MHTHAPKETFKLSRTKEREREREKRNESQTRLGERQKRTKKLPFSSRSFFPTVCCVCVCAAAPNSLKVSPSLWLLFVRFFEAKISPFFPLCAS